MKTNKILLVCALALGIPAVLTSVGQTKDLTVVEAAEVLKEYEFTEKVFDKNGTKTLGELGDWTLSGDGDYWSYDGTKGQQFGSGSKPYKSMGLTSVDSFSNVKTIKINTSGASKIAGSFTVAVGTEIKPSTALTATATEYTFDFTGSLPSGAIQFAYTQTSSKAYYVKSIVITYEDSSAQEQPKYDVSFAPGIGSGTMDTVQSYAKYELPESTFIAPDGYQFSGWTDGTSNDLYKPGDNYTLSGNTTFTANFIAVNTYYKVEKALSDWSGNYIIASSNYILDASLDLDMDANNNNQVVTINENLVSCSGAYQFTIEKVEGGYSIKTPNGYYIGNNTNSNDLLISDTEKYVNTIEYSNGNVVITSGTKELGFNSASNALRFRYAGYSGAIQLYCDRDTSQDEAEESPTEIIFEEDTLSLAMGETKNLGVLVEPETATAYTIESSNEKVAKYVDGKVVGLTEGTATITATSSADASVTASCEVTVGPFNYTELEFGALLTDLETTTNGQKVYKSSAEVTEITNTTYGNLYLSDGNSSILAYGATALKEALSFDGTVFKYASQKTFSENELTKGIEVGDTLEFYAIRSEHDSVAQLQIIVLNVTKSTPEAPAGTETFVAETPYASLGLSYTRDGETYTFTRLSLFLKLDFDYSQFGDATIEETGLYLQLGEFDGTLTNANGKIANTNKVTNFCVELTAPTDEAELAAMYRTSFNVVGYVVIGGQTYLTQVKTYSFDEMLNTYKNDTNLDETTRAIVSEADAYLEGLTA